jgi:hypothetical protein
MVGVRSPLSSALTIIIDPQVPRTDEVLSTPRAPKRTAVLRQLITDDENRG